MIRPDNLSADYDTITKNTGPSFAGRVRFAFARAFRAVIAAQEARAKRSVDGYMARQSDEVLKRLGRSDAEIEVIRRQGAGVPLGWM
ncbi:MAG: hypothetical protein ABL904_02925 [Hyphomicrobiaceae bacterium]